MMDKSQKRRYFQLTSVMLCSLFLVSGPLKIELTVSSETSVRNDHSMLHYIRRAEISHDIVAMQALVWL